MSDMAPLPPRWDLRSNDQLVNDLATAQYFAGNPAFAPDLRAKSGDRAQAILNEMARRGFVPQWFDGSPDEVDL